MRIVLDAMGSDNYPEPEVEAAIKAKEVFGDEIILVGDTNILKPRLEKLGGPNFSVKLVHAPEVLEMGDKAAASARRKAQNSMAIGMGLLKNNEADAFVTAGNTGGAMANALFTLGRIRGVKRPALAGLFPVKGGHCVVTDIGANAECKPEYLVQFAVMGSLYAQKVLKIENPRVGLISNGEEAGKGNDLVKATYPLMQQAGLNFIGNIEGKELFGGHADVAVTDGFTGNVLLKASEAVAKMMTEILRQELKSNPVTMLGAILAKPAFSKLKAMLDPSETGAAPLLGIDGLVFVGHGRSDAKALVSAIRVARQAVESGVLQSMRDKIQTQLADINLPAEAG